MKFTECFKITKSESDDWFDPILSIDTKLFIDPFLIYADNETFFEGSHTEVIDFFDYAFKLIAASSGNRHSNSWRLAKSILVFPEAFEFCLGYTKDGTHGAGSGSGYANTIAESLWEAVQAGVKEITHFEEIGLLREGIGADRIADITATLLRHRFAAYTNDVCNRLGIATSHCKYNRGVFSSTAHKWSPTTFMLPLNPATNQPILLTPERYLRELPTINSSSFWDYCFDNVNEQLRAEFSSDILRHVKKAHIIEFASKHPEIRRQYILSTEHDKPEPYDLNTDPKGYARWYEDSAKYCESHPFQKSFTNLTEFSACIDGIIDEYINFIENNGGWRLLWNESNTPKREEAAQLLFLGIVKHYCKANDIDISKEVNIGRGPVDFKAAQGHMLRALLELKLAKNTKFWNGLGKQLPLYMKSEGISRGYFIVIVYKDNDIKRLKNISEHLQDLTKRTGYSITVKIVDARTGPLPASKV